MFKKIVAASVMLTFLGLGASQLFAKSVPMQSLRECTYPEENQCLSAYSGAPLTACVYTWGRINCVYSDGTRRFIFN